FAAPTINLPSGERFPREKLFGVSARTVSWFDGKPNQVCMGVTLKGGRLTPSWIALDEPARCVFVQAGAAAYNRAHFLRLGGVNKVYHPGYWEDYDISYYAAKRGLINLYDTHALALHHGGGSMTRRYGHEEVNRMKARNHLY